MHKITHKIQESFLKLAFHPIELTHKQQLEPLLLKDVPQLTGFTFASLMSWKIIFRYEWALVEDGSLIVSGILPNQQNRYLLQPIGPFTQRCQEMLLTEMYQTDHPIIIYGVSDRFIKRNPEFIIHFDILNDTAYSNYIYKAEDLALLPGRKFAKKRNMIAQAENSYQWEAKPITDHCLPECLVLLGQIAFDDQIEKNQDLINERQALDYTLRHFNELNQQGIVINVDEKPVAFSVYEQLNPTTAVVHFEKADRNLKGLYQLINCETSRVILDAGYDFIDREEDMNLPGLRKSKKSYNPVELRAAYMLVFKK